jgi:hypothetical protein
MDTLYLDKIWRSLKLTIQPPSGSEVKDILNVIAVQLNIIETAAYNNMCLEGAGLCLAEEQLCAKLLRFNESLHLERGAFRLHTHTLTP